MERQEEMLECSKNIIHKLTIAQLLELDEWLDQLIYERIDKNPNDAAEADKILGCGDNEQTMEDAIGQQEEREER
jgi:hypothetical protein